MKMFQAVKKLKFWSRKNKKKKKKKNHVIEHPPPPPPCHCHCSYHPIQPSAPPLPPWLDYGQPHDTILAAECNPTLGFASSSQAQLPPQEIVPELNLNPLDPTLPITTSFTSYQQYMVPNPVYGMPVAPQVRRERRAGLFGCVVDIGIHLIRCFCPCFRTREVY